MTDRIHRQTGTSRCLRGRSDLRAARTGVGHIRTEVGALVRPYIRSQIDLTIRRTGCGSIGLGGSSGRDACREHHGNAEDRQSQGLFPVAHCRVPCGFAERDPRLLDVVPVFMRYNDPSHEAFWCKRKNSGARGQGGTDEGRRSLGCGAGKLAGDAGGGEKDDRAVVLLDPGEGA
jgi:hypothetical protein